MYSPLHWAIPAVSGVLFLLAIRGHLALVWSVRTIPEPPVPSVLVGHALDVRKARVGTRYNVWAQRYGPTYKLRGPFLEPILVVGDPKGASHVLMGNAVNYPRTKIDRIALELWFGKGLFSVEDDEHKRQRRMLNPAFSAQSVHEVSHVFFDLAHRLKSQWEATLGGQDSAVFDVAATIHTLTMDAISMTMFSYNCSASEGAIPTLLHHIANAPGAGDDASTLTLLAGALIAKFPRLLRVLPSPIKRWADSLRTELGVIAEDVWHQGKRSVGMEAKILELLDGGLTNDEAVAQIIALLFAGSETVANVISETFLELARQPRIQDTLREELLDFERRTGRTPTTSDLTSNTALPYLEAVTREAMRTKTVLMRISREAAADDVIPLEFPVVGTGATEIHIKAGQAIAIPVRDGINIDPRLWGADAAQFRPERWIEKDGLPESVRSIRALGNTLAFGDGPRMCLGRYFALAEFKIVIVVMLRHFAFEDAGVKLDFYHLGGNTVKPKVRGREGEGVQMPIRVKEL